MFRLFPNCIIYITFSNHSGKVTDSRKYMSMASGHILEWKTIKRIRLHKQHWHANTMRLRKMTNKWCKISCKCVVAFPLFYFLCVLGKMIVVNELCHMVGWSHTIIAREKLISIFHSTDFSTKKISNVYNAIWIYKTVGSIVLTAYFIAVKWFHQKIWYQHSADDRHSNTWYCLS